MLQLILFSIFFFFLFPAGPGDFVRYEKLSEYHFFEGSLAELRPAPDVFPYTVNTPLFSNYAGKLRFFKLPPGTQMTYRDSSVFDFPVGAVLIKNFYYPVDFRKPEKGRILLETRLLVHETGGWQAYPYIWNEEQTEAYYDPAGETREVRYINDSGKKIVTPYLVPNKNQCKGCHISGDRLLPIGPTARQLNTKAPGEETNQLLRWRALGLIQDFPVGRDLPRAIVWDDPATGSLNDRARAYLDANCAHCHSRQGSANTSGLFLDAYENNPSRLGVMKGPVAAGRGAGSMQYDIVPGEPGKSILVYRMRTNDPAIAMPEIGREQVHREGLALIEEWIRSGAAAEH